MENLLPRVLLALGVLAQAMHETLERVHIARVEVQVPRRDQHVGKVLDIVLRIQVAQLGHAALAVQAHALLHHRAQHGPG